MREHELELIAALVEGRLEDESEARALIESSPELAEEYEAQKLAYEAMRGAGTTSLRETERAALHRDIWTELRSGSIPAASRSPWYYRWAPVAAGFLVVVGLVAVLGQGGADSGEEAVNLADAAADTTTTAASDDGAAGGDAAPGDGDDTAQTESSSEEDKTDSDRTVSPEEADLFTMQAQRVRAGEFSDSQLETFDNEGQTAEHTDCFTRIGLDRHRIVATTSSLDGETLLVTVPQETDLANAPVGFVDPDVCELVYLDE